MRQRVAVNQVRYVNKERSRKSKQADGSTVAHETEEWNWVMN